MNDFLKRLQACEYLAHRYELGEFPNLPLADEPFVREWGFWIENPKESPFDVNGILPGVSDETVSLRLEQTPAGRIPVLRTRTRAGFERVRNALYPGGFKTGIPASVNAFTVIAKRPPLAGHRIIILNRAGYSALSGKELGMEEEEWLEKSMTLRLNHEICHYFSLRVLGGMRNHALDEIAADCAGQLAAFGAFKAALQRLFFGISEEGGKILPGGRFSFYIKRLRGASVDAVLEATNAALGSLESWLAENPDMTLESNRPRLVTNLLTAGIPGIRR